MSASHRSFINYEETISGLRVSMMKEVEAMVEPIGQLDCIGQGVGITSVDNGNVDVYTIFYDYFGKSVQLKDETGLVHDYADLDTDDMNAIYEHVYYRVFEKEEK